MFSYIYYLLNKPGYQTRLVITSDATNSTNISRISPQLSQDLLGSNAHMNSPHISQSPSNLG